MPKDPDEENSGSGKGRSLTRSQIDKLGKRLASAAAPAAADLRLLETLLQDYESALGQAQRILMDALSPSFLIASRLKSTGTIVDKLRRGTSLSGMQDIAGLRVWTRSTLSEQDDAVEGIKRAFGGGRIVDRRTTPTFGYRAVHLIANVDECPVEIQVRTRLQDLWAQVVEKLGDAWGRQIRYGGLPDEPQAPSGHISGLTRLQLLDLLMDLSLAIASVEEGMERLLEQEGALSLQEERANAQNAGALEQIRAELSSLKAKTREEERGLELSMESLVERLQ